MYLTRSELRITKSYSLRIQKYKSIKTFSKHSCYSKITYNVYKKSKDRIQNTFSVLQCLIMEDMRPLAPKCLFLLLGCIFTWFYPQDTLL